MKAAFYTLGCKVNQYDTQEMRCALEKSGYEITDCKEAADVYIINSCTVTAQSSRKSRQALNRLRMEHPNAVIVLTGCYSQAFADDAALRTQADIILGNKTNTELTAVLAQFMEKRKKIINVRPHAKDELYSGELVSSFEGHTRAFVKIQDGCNRYCSYCIIPKSRGFSRSKPLADIKKETENIAANGYKEIVFVGINLSAYGLDCGLNICDALEIAENTAGIERFRLGSLEPDHITDAVIARLTSFKKFCPQFHLSLQSGSDAILKRMNRHYSAEEYLELCEKLRSAFPDMSLTTDIIAGFPGETEENFNETVEFTNRAGFMKAHIFPFSPREGTPAFSYPKQISAQEKERRCALLQKNCDSIREKILSSLNGKKAEVLFETPKDDMQQGYTKTYIPVAVKCSECLTGQIREVLIESAEDGCCRGVLI